jgi:hypothetical protein
MLLNPKSEYLNPKQRENSNYQNSKLPVLSMGKLFGFAQDRQVLNPTFFCV